MTLIFDQDQYHTAPGGTFDVQVLLDPVPAAGLFSMGVRVTFDGDKVRVNSLDDIVLPDAINSDGLGGAALKSIGTGSAGFSFAGAAAGVVQWEGYKEPLLVTISLTDLTPSSAVPNSYELGLDFYFDAFANFVDFNGDILDSQITAFNSAQVHVIPEPAGLILGFLGGFLVVGVKRIKGKRR